MKRLYVVRVDPEPFDMCVVAESAEQAAAIASRAARAESDNLPPEFHIGTPIVATSVAEVPGDLRDVLPYGDSADLTAAEFLSAPTKEPT